MTSSTVFLRTLQELARFASNEDAREYLNGVYVENHDGYSIYVATNGHMLCARRIEDDEINAIGNFIVPTGVLKQCKFKPSDSDMRATLVMQPDGSCIISDETSARKFVPIDGTFPDWRRVATIKASGVPAQYNWAYMMEFVKMGKALGIGNPRLMPNGNDPALITFGQDGYAYGVLMPMRADDVATVTPDWINTTPLKIAA